MQESGKRSLHETEIKLESLGRAANDPGETLRKDRSYERDQYQEGNA